MLLRAQRHIAPLVHQHVAAPGVPRHTLDPAEPRHPLLDPAAERVVVEGDRPPLGRPYRFDAVIPGEAVLLRDMRAAQSPSLRHTLTRPD